MGTIDDKATDYATRELNKCAFKGTLLGLGLVYLILNISLGYYTTASMLNEGKKKAQIEQELSSKIKQEANPYLRGIADFVLLKLPRPGREIAYKLHE